MMLSRPFLSKHEQGKWPRVARTGPDHAEQLDTQNWPFQVCVRVYIYPRTKNLIINNHNDSMQLLYSCFVFWIVFYIL